MIFFNTSRVFKGLVCLSLFGSISLLAHFQVIKPTSDHVGIKNRDSMKIEYAFMHPFEQTYMEMEKPLEVGYFLGGKKHDLLGSLKEKRFEKSRGWELDFSFKRAGDYLFYVDPKPYFEPAEGKFIRHITKTVISAFNQEEGWDEIVGLKAEIVPLTRPYGLWSGNIFSGQVLYKGKPYPNAEIEVEFLNEGSKIEAPQESMITQVIKADSSGIFHYSMPFRGMWGFAALIEDDEELEHDGKSYPIELGALIWLKTY